MSKCEFKLDKSTAHYKVHISGIIDEDFSFDAHSLAGCETVDIWMGGVKTINSCGIREWMKWLATSAKVPLKFHNCPKIIIDQINIVHGFLPLGRSEVISFFVPYFSIRSSEKKDVLFCWGTEFNESGLLEPQVKDSFGELMQMDVAKIKYFRFLNSRMKAA